MGKGISAVFKHWWNTLQLREDPASCNAIRLVLLYKIMLLLEMVGA